MEHQEVVYALFMAYQKLNGEIDNNLIYIFKEKMDASIYKEKLESIYEEKDVQNIKYYIVEEPVL